MLSSLFPKRFLTLEQLEMHWKTNGDIWYMNLCGYTEILQTRTIQKTCKNGILNWGIYIPCGYRTYLWTNKTGRFYLLWISLLSGPLLEFEKAPPDRQACQMTSFSEGRGSELFPDCGALTAPPQHQELPDFQIPASWSICCCSENI